MSCSIVPCNIEFRIIVNRYRKLWGSYSDRSVIIAELDTRFAIMGVASRFVATDAGIALVAFFLLFFLNKPSDGGCVRHDEVGHHGRRTGVSRLFYSGRPPTVCTKQLALSVYSAS